MDAPETATDPYLTTDDVAHRLKLKPNTLAVWRKRREQGGPPFVKLCGAVRYRASAVEAWLRANEKGAAE